MKTCPHCAEEIQDAAVKCRHCGGVVVSPAWQKFCTDYRSWAPPRQKKEFDALSDDQKTQFNAAWTALGYDQAPVVPAKTEAKTVGCAGSGCVIGLALLAVVVITGMMIGDGDSGRSAPPSPVVSNSPWDGSVRQVEKYLDRALKDPDSFDAIEWSQVVKTPEGGFQVDCRYRAKNSFGGYVIAAQRFTLDTNGNVISATDIK